MPPWMHDASQLACMLRICYSYHPGPYCIHADVGRTGGAPYLPIYYSVLPTPIQCNLLGPQKGTLPPTWQCWLSGIGRGGADSQLSIPMSTRVLYCTEVQAGRGGLVGLSIEARGDAFHPPSMLRLQRR
ncbi:hypothetical protein HDV57DRAFT_497443 [Trichoderma longibrachiatum]